MRYDVWFKKELHGEANLFLISGLDEITANRLTEALNDEFPDCFFWKE